MYEDEILNLKACLPHLTEDVLEQALNAVDGDLTRAMNHLLDGTTVSIPSNPGSPIVTDPIVFEDWSVVPVAPTRSQTGSRAPTPVAVPSRGYVSPVPYDDDDEAEEFVPPPELPIQMDETRLQSERADLMEFRVKVHEPIGLYPQKLVEQMIENLFKNKCQVDEFKLNRRTILPRAEYEEQVAEWRYDLAIIMKEGESGPRERILKLYTFLARFCHFSSLELHNQLMIELPDYHKSMRNLVVHHTKLPVVGILLGNCPNPGLFFIRGYYVTHYNEYSNSVIANSCKRRARGQKVDDSHATKVTGNQNYRSYADFEHDRRILTIYFAVQIPQQPDGLMFSGYKLVIPYASIVQVVIHAKSEEYKKSTEQCTGNRRGVSNRNRTNIVVDQRALTENALSLKLKHPPQLWEANPRFQGGRRFVNLESARNNDWVRVLQFAGEQQPDGKCRFKGCSKEALADCQWIQFQIPSGDEGSRPGDSKIVLMEIVSRIMNRSNAKVHFGAIFAQWKRLPVVTEIASVGSFRADYALKATISRGSVVTDQLFEYVETDTPTEHIFFKYVRRCFKECRRACEEALENLLAAVDERRSFEVLKAFQHLYKSRFDSHLRILNGDTRNMSEVADLKKALPKNCVMVRKVMITPLRRLFMAPEVMMTNRVVRKYGEEYALRCVFRDENGGKLQVKDFVSGYGSEQQSAIITAMVHQALTHGVEINNRTYQFLAWSNSQMRDHGCYMYAPIYAKKTGELLTSIDQMRDWMGDFSKVKSVPKLMSRMGQCFTQAQPTVILSKTMWRVDEDFEGGCCHPETAEQYCFSDGCGRIAPSLAKSVSQILELDLIPSCFQVRFKGFKGILVVDPNLDLIENGPKAVFRKSQQKFHVDDEDEDSNILEIVKYSMPSPVCLNRPMIAILDWVAEAQNKQLHKKLSRKVHFYLERELSILGEMLMNEKTAAEQLTQRINLPIDFLRLRASGFSLTDEPLIRKMLVSVYRYNIANHLTKLKIFIPASQGRCMYGVVDETGTLQYGQVFIQYSPSIRHASDRPKLHLGPVLVTKNPCHVAGDCRMFQAVDQPALAHLIDVVVFPRYGPRPHPDEMAGSDLDGDEYSVIFDPDIHFERNEEAMIFPKTSAEEFDEPPQTEAMVHFFLKYLRQDAIGKVSNAHLIMADRRGLFDDIPNDIARKCSVAVDFPKSGQPADPLSPAEQSDRNPDYMATNYKPVYRSKRLNGQLYRKARKVEEVLELTEHLDSVFENSVDRIIVPDDENFFVGAYELKQKYRQLRDEYATRMQQLLDEYGITDEAAIVSGHIVSLKRITGMERDDYSFYHTDKIVELRYAKIFHHFRSLFLKEWGTEEDLTEIAPDGTRVLRTNPGMFEKARRWYYLAYVDSRSSNRAPGPCKSFPWVIWDVLAAFKRDRLLRLGEALQRENPVADALNEEIEFFKRRNEQEYKNFIAQQIKTDGVIKRYLVAYGDTVADILFVLANWLYKEKIFDLASTPMTMYHVALLFIQFCRGKHHGCSGVADTVESAAIFLKPAPDPPYNLFPAPMNTAVILIDFLRYLGSQRFSLCDHLQLQVDSELYPPILMRQNQWMPLSQLAFRTYHHIAVSGRFDALHLYPTNFDLLENETRDPIVVSGELFNTKNYSQAAIQCSVVIERLKQWSGISFMNFRPDRNHSKNRVGQYLCTVFGTVVARQKIARLLQMDVDLLLKNVAGNKIPDQVYDMSL